MNVDKYDERVEKFLSNADIDFGYAVGNLQEDTTVQSRIELRQQLHKLLVEVQLELVKKFSVDNWQKSIPEQYILDKLKELQQSLSEATEGEA